MSEPRDTSPQPPNERPVQTLARLLKEAGAVLVIDGIPLNTTLEERIALLLKRIAALEAQLAEAQARLAMFAEAYEECDRELRSAGPRGETIWPWNRFAKGWIAAWCGSLSVMDEKFSGAYNASDERVCAFRLRLKRQGAAEELRRLADDWHHMDPNGARTPCADGCTKCELLARAAELEGA